MLIDVNILSYRRRGCLSVIIIPVQWPTWEEEKTFYLRGYKLIAGVDEAGRGPLAGPIVAAAVILPFGAQIDGLNDSKLLSEKQREALYKTIKKLALAIEVAQVSHKIIDQINIGKANRLALAQAVAALQTKPHFVLVDGRRMNLDLPIPQLSIIGGDRKSVSIAAASVIAKVSRDRLMLKWHEKYPEYGFDQHKGYGTREHFKKLKKHGPCPIHRRSFSPVKAEG